MWIVILNRLILITMNSRHAGESFNYVVLLRVEEPFHLISADRGNALYIRLLCELIYDNLVRIDKKKKYYFFFLLPGITISLFAELP